MDLNEIVVFARVVETGSFTAAAESLGLPKSTVSRKVAQLEERLDARLLQRTTRKLSLTDVGRAYYERCQRIVADIAAAEQLVVELQAAPRGLLRLTAPVDVGALYLGCIIADFLAQSPEIQIELVLSDKVFDLVDERLDLAVRFGPLPDSTLVSRRLGGMTTFVVASPGYIEKRGAPKQPEDILAHDVIAFVPVSRMRLWKLQGPGRELELTPAPRFSANGMFAVREAVQRGAGISLLPDFAVHRELDDGSLVRILPEWKGTDADLFAVYPSTRNLSPKLRTFLDFLTAKLTPTPWTR